MKFESIKELNTKIETLETRLKELEENKILDEFYTDEKEDDTVSIDSISEYEDEDQYDDEIIQIKNFKETQENKYNLKNNLFELEIETH